MSFGSADPSKEVVREVRGREGGGGASVDSSPAAGVLSGRDDVAVRGWLGTVDVSGNAVYAI